MTEYAEKRLRDGELVTFHSTKLPYGLMVKKEKLIILTDEATMIVPKDLVTEIVEARRLGII